MANPIDIHAGSRFVFCFLFFCVALRSRPRTVQGRLHQTSAPQAESKARPGRPSGLPTRRNQKGHRWGRACYSLEPSRTPLWPDGARTTSVGPQPINHERRKHGWTCRSTGVRSSPKHAYRKFGAAAIPLASSALLAHVQPKASAAVLATPIRNGSS